MHRRPVLRAAVGGAVTAVAGCLTGETSGDEETEEERGTNGERADDSDTSEDDYTIEMNGSTEESYGGSYWFDPIGLYVPVDTTVTWISLRGTPHTATAYEDRIPEEAEPFDSPSLIENQTYEYTFTVPGTYDYVCLPHRTYEMVGRVVCGEPGGPATGTETPDGPVPEAERIVEEGRLSPSDVFD